ncbi:MAG: flagellar basal body L-ring protein FlgH [Alphaproteobacteria bacterium]|nr:flagellar basal body L-ring protein FlgH [Alphaproteobacteria bacterium]HPF47516.1 flagellar basal body L-ring protein FlgH [Emcibacteraceae bacterium]
MKNSILTKITPILLLFTLSACGTLDRIGNIGSAPDLAPIADDRVIPQQALATPIPVTRQNAVFLENKGNSLWRTGSRAFFKDARASAVGDILTVNITINDAASINNATTRTRANSEDLNMNKMLGLETLVPDSLTPGDLVNTTGATSNVGTGKVDRKESINLVVAAVVTQVLPNGNLVIQGKQEVRVNFEVREMTIMGVIRPEDISSTNTIEHTQIAEARISYGGRGQLTDFQQPRYGSQLFDILFPF